MVFHYLINFYFSNRANVIFNWDRIKCTELKNTVGSVVQLMQSCNLHIYQDKEHSHEPTNYLMSLFPFSTPSDTVILVILWFVSPEISFVCFRKSCKIYTIVKCKILVDFQKRYTILWVTPILLPFYTSKRGVNFENFYFGSLRI